MSPLALALLLAAAAGPASTEPSVASTEPATLALIVASNGGFHVGRPPLQYADDDGAKYYYVFSALAGAEGTWLLTEMDRDTTRLFPELTGVALPPTRAELFQAGLRAARRARELRQAGRPVRLYFVFAGHGDVEEGRGFIELPDGPFDADDLQALLQGIGATETHVILDSCNAYFVVNPRKPGGQRVPTPADAAEALAARLPDVGVFLSTAAQAEVYEWSELQSGVFSHAVRSGLLGAADADGDGRVSYQELAAFVETAAAGIRNPHFRPRIFARGPNGDDQRAILVVPREARARLEVDEAAPVRLSVRDADGPRWLDAHKEAGAALRTWFPAGRAGALEVERLVFGQWGEVSRAASYRIPDPPPEPVRLERLASSEEVMAGRGAGEIFRSLFSHPYGPDALAAFVASGGAAGLRERPELWRPVPGEGRSALSLVLRGGVGAPAVRLSGLSPPEAGPTTPGRPGLRTGYDLSLAAMVTIRPALTIEAEAGWLQARSGRIPFAVPGEIYAGTGLPGAALMVRAVPVLLNVRLGWPREGLRPYLLAGLGWTLLGLEAKPDLTPAIRLEAWAPSVQVGGGLVLLERPGGFSAGLEFRYLTLVSQRALGVGFGVQSARGGLVIGWQLPELGGSSP